MSEDNEIDAMKQIAMVLEPLEQPARQRILHWANSRFGQSPTQHSQSISAFPTSLESADNRTQPYETFADLFEAAHPATDREKALVASYWIQVCQKQGSFASQSINDELKNLGHGVGNITEALTSLRDERPALILQLKKSGTSRQARKTYKLTVEGSRRVTSMIDGGE